MTIYITGASGFVGKNLVGYLSEGNQIQTPSRVEIGHPAFADAIVHLAGKAHDLRNVSSADEYYDVNYELTVKVFSNFLESDASTFIFVSSVKATADHVSGELNENSTPNPQTHYGKSKLKAEEFIRAAELPSGKRVYILRPCMIHGPGNKGNLNLLYQFVKRGIPYPLASFNNQRSFLSVQNLCFVIKELIEREDIASGVYHVADDEPLSTNELVEIISTELRQTPRLWKINPGLIKFLASVGDKLHLPLTTERLNKLTENYVVDTSKLRKALGKPFPVTTREGIRKTIRSFNDKGL